MKKIYGIPIALFAIGIIMAIGATAVIVNYLSNTATATVDVESPMEIAFGNIKTLDEATGGYTLDGSYEPTLSIPDTTGLGTSEVGVYVKNKANVIIAGKWLRLSVSNSLANVDCADITSLTFMDTATPTQIAKGFQELSGLCVDGGAYTQYDIDINSLAPGTVYQYPAKITFGNVAPSTYTFSAQMIQ
jgi:hypothetical protein